MKAEDKTFSHSRGTPVAGSSASGAAALSASASNNCAVSASSDSAELVASRRCCLRALTLGQGVSSEALDTPYRPRSRRVGWASQLEAQKHSPLRKSAAIRLKPLWPANAVRIQKRSVLRSPASQRGTISPRDGAEGSTRAGLRT